MGVTRRQLGLALVATAGAGRAVAADTPTKMARLPSGALLHYVEQGRGEPVIFSHGSLSDYTYWENQMAPFAARYRAIAYSRRYNWPNDNPAIVGYSAVVDAADLAALITALDLGPAHVVGHSYGALTALFLAARRPDLLRTVTLAEPPAIPLLAQLSAPDTTVGRAMFDDIQARMVAPMRAAFAGGDREGGVRAFIDYVRGRPGVWDSFSATDKAATLRDAREWDVMMTRGALFPDIAPAEVAAIRTPTLILSGGRSYPFLGLIDAELARLIPRASHLAFPDATHQMWLEHPAECRQAVFELIEGRRAPSEL